MGKAKTTMREIATDPAATHFFVANEFNNDSIHDIYQSIAGQLTWEGIYLSSWQEQ